MLHYEKLILMATKILISSVGILALLIYFYRKSTFKLKLKIKIEESFFERLFVGRHWQVKTLVDNLFQNLEMNISEEGFIAYTNGYHQLQEIKDDFEKKLKKDSKADNPIYSTFISKTLANVEYGIADLALEYYCLEYLKPEFKQNVVFVERLGYAVLQDIIYAEKKKSKEINLSLLETMMLCHIKSVLQSLNISRLMELFLPRLNELIA